MAMSSQQREFPLTDLSDRTRSPHEWTTLGPSALARHIVDTHHRYLRDELPSLDELSELVLLADVARHPELAEVRALVLALRADLEPHLLKEERILFPAIDALAAGQREFPFGTVANPIRVMQLDHEGAGQLLAELRTATGDFVVPADASARCRDLYERLARLEVDTREHMHKESDVLFPATLELASS